jgi:hypothetical protein
MYVCISNSKLKKQKNYIYWTEKVDDYFIKNKKRRLFY